MKKKVTPKGFDEASRTTRVKMYKSGKQWVQCLLTRLGMIKLSSGVKPEEVRVETNLDSKTTSLLKGVLAASALIGGGAGATPSSKVDNNARQNLAKANTVSLGSNNDSTGAESQTSDSASLSMSESGSQSTTESASDSKSDSRSTSQDTTSESASVSASESVANSQSGLQQV